MEQKTTIEDVFDLGTWLGRKQAFTLVAGRCTAADAECMREIKEKKLYAALEDTWEDFCRNRLGISRAFVDKQIRQLEQLGPNYSRLNSFTRIKPADYRLIAAAVTDDGLCYGGETIPIESDHAPQLAQAVEALCRELAPPPPPPSDPAAEALAKAEKSLQSALAEFQRLQDMNLDDDRRLKVLLAVEGGRDRLDHILLSTSL